MDLRKTIEQLHRHKEKLEKAIASLEELQRLVGDKTLETKRRHKTSLKPEPSENSRDD